MALRDRNEKLFYRTIAENISYFLPVIYTPTVGQACMEYGFHFTRPRGIFISIYDRGHIRSILENWPFVNVKAIVVTGTLCFVRLRTSKRGYIWRFVGNAVVLTAQNN